MDEAKKYVLLHLIDIAELLYLKGTDLHQDITLIQTEKGDIFLEADDLSGCLELKFNGEWQPEHKHILSLHGEVLELGELRIELDKDCVPHQRKPAGFYCDECERTYHSSPYMFSCDDHDQDYCAYCYSGQHEGCAGIVKQTCTCKFQGYELIPPN